MGRQPPETTFGLQHMLAANLKLEPADVTKLFYGVLVPAGTRFGFMEARTVHGERSIHQDDLALLLLDPRRLAELQRAAGDGIDVVQVLGRMFIRRIMGVTRARVNRVLAEPQPVVEPSTGPTCFTCGTSMRAAGNVYVCEGCGSTAGMSSETG